MKLSDLFEDFIHIKLASIFNQIKSWLFAYLLGKFEFLC